MTADPKASLGPAGPAPVNRPHAGEAFFQQSIADLSRRLGERGAKQSASEPEAAAESRRRAMKSYERERARKLRLVLGGVGAVAVTAGIAWFVVFLAEPEAPAASSQIVSAQPAPPAPASPVAMASTVPEPPAPQTAEAPPPPAAPPPVVDTQLASPPPSPAPPQTVAAPPSDPPPVEPAPAARPLRRDEIREVQKRLAGFGFNPGPADGVAGRQTEVATQRYLEARGQPQMPPTEPQLLDQLRQDPAPQVAQTPQVAQRSQPRAGQAGQAANSPPARRSFDPFEPVKVAGAEITRWLQSAFR
jgi:hypothetical protein